MEKRECVVSGCLIDGEPGSDPGTSDRSRKSRFPAGKADADPGSLPGVLIFSAGGETLYKNREGAELLRRIDAAQDVCPESAPRLPKLIFELLIAFGKEIAGRQGRAISSESSRSNHLLVHDGLVYLIRPLCLERRGTEGPPHLLILLEKVSAGGLDHGSGLCRLTERERRVIALLLKGKTNKEIGSALNLAEDTVKKHIKQIMRRLKVTTRSGIVAHLFHCRPAGAFEAHPFRHSLHSAKL